jgi:hypothetical protein
MKNDDQFQQRFNQETRGGSNYGPGLYVSSKLDDSAEYCGEGNEGVLIQVVLPGQDTPYISFTDQAIMQELRQGNPSVIRQDIDRQFPVMPSILVHATGTWYVLKTQEVILFREFNGEGSNIVEIQAALDAIKSNPGTKRVHPILLGLVTKAGAPFAAHAFQ